MKSLITFQGRSTPKRKLSQRQSAGDRYSVLKKLEAKHDSKAGTSPSGWSTKVLHGDQGQFGWSQDVLGYDSAEEENEIEGTSSPMSSDSEVAPCSRDGRDGRDGSGRPASLEMLEEKLSSLRVQSWDTSPQRTFIRNFP